MTHSYTRVPASLCVHQCCVYTHKSLQELKPRPELPYKTPHFSTLFDWAQPKPRIVRRCLIAPDVGGIAADILSYQTPSGDSWFGLRPIKQCPSRKCHGLSSWRIYSSTAQLTCISRMSDVKPDVPRDGQFYVLSKTYGCCSRSHK